MEGAYAGHTDVVKRLLAAGADPKIKDVGRTAREWARITLRSLAGRRYMMAEVMKCTEPLTLLKAAGAKK
jgi:glycine cleavage system aminomethyltransferase T